MNVRFVVSLALAAALLLGQDLARSQPAPASPRMFSQWYSDTLRDVLTLEEGDVDRLERQLATNPDDLAARLKLMAYHERADRAGLPEDRRKRLRYAIWLIEHYPDSEILHSSVSRFSKGELSSDYYRRAVDLWNLAVKNVPGNASILWNAASFFKELDLDRHVYYLEETAVADPDHPFAIRPLADYYALSVLEGGTHGARSLSKLEASTNQWILSNAAHTLQNQYNVTLQQGEPRPRAAALAEHFFQLSLVFDPTLERNKILPQIDLQEIARAQQASHHDRLNRAARAEAVAHRMRRLPPEAFPELPATIAEVLRARKCSVPQPDAIGKARNVIRGEFFASGEIGWAVFCSVNGSTTLLAFRNDYDTKPDAVTTREDLPFAVELGDGSAVYSFEIRAIGRDSIMNHYRAYGGLKPPPIDHQGIDEGILDKASVTWYFHQGKWLQLAGAD